MIKLLLILSLFISIFAHDTPFILPNNHSALLHYFGVHFKKAQTIVIISPTFNHSDLKKKIEKSAQKGAQVTLLLNNPKGDPLSMVQYLNIELFISPVQLHGTTVVVDKRIMCHFAGKIDQEEMSSHKQNLHCTDHKEAIEKQNAIVQTLIAKGKPYLQ
ncbi:hypothetical protein [Sulfuricurvum sp.]|uniref:hypothetical protein n=1 Tax=Sulfuricurvum sp. TaxID=2025608 RepID=UPI0019C6565F|nr:hypothetical protein [Sulfuricurvum sp.]MBD3799502.1 phosphatidylserine/phosphatidylglycerophosphate/cardiolipin synthase family protein [Campylobacterota bacterium]MBD3806893.1 phosphatidylserine/phosphatidylglycerophosphate/cardiolipin synthase family protein [Sulfuricurvum sp.]